MSPCWCFYDNKQRCRKQKGKQLSKWHVRATGLPTSGRPSTTQRQPSTGSTTPGRPGTALPESPKSQERTKSEPPALWPAWRGPSQLPLAPPCPSSPRTGRWVRGPLGGLSSRTSSSRATSWAKSASWWCQWRGRGSWMGWRSIMT